MRSRSPRVVEDLARDEIDELLAGQPIGRIGCHADGVTYVVPVIHAYDGEFIYVASVEGRKVEMMRANPSVCFEVDEYEGAAAGWRSVIVQGVFEELDDAGAERALALLADRFGRGRDGRARRRAAPEERARVCFRIAIAKATGRAVRR